MNEGKKFDRFYVDKRDLEYFKKLKEKDSPFSNLDNKNIFIAAMALGFKENKMMKLDSKEGYFLTDYLNDHEKALINSIAIYTEKDIKVLLDKEKIFTIAEEYARGGIMDLYERVFGKDYGTYDKKLEDDLIAIFNEKIIPKTNSKKIQSEDIKNISIQDLIQQEEGEFLEFKSSFFWNYKTNTKDVKMAQVIAKTISSFMNAKGGILIVGVSDDKKILGLEKDLALYKDKDALQVNIINILGEYLGKQNIPNMKMTFEKIDDRDIAIIKVPKKAPYPVYVKIDGGEEFYVRCGNTSQPYSMQEAIEYIKTNW